MIWHFLEVWVSMLIAFALGGAIGALLYGVIARSRLAMAQGAAADAVGDVMDGIKARLGVGPVWRPEYRRIAGRAVLASDGELDLVAFQDEPPAVARRERTETPAAAPIAIVETEIESGGNDAERERSWRGPEGEPEIAGDDVEGDLAKTPEPATRPVADDVVAMRPAGLTAPRNGVPDNLQRIRGVGERNEALLNSLGIFHFGQIAAWTPAEMRWVAGHLAFPERLERDDWVGQATVLASGGETGVTKSAERRRARRQQEQLEDEATGSAGEDVTPDDR